MEDYSQVDVNELVEIMNIWWEGWKRFGDEGDYAPQHIQSILYELGKQKKYFNLETGKWVN